MSLKPKVAVAIALIVGGIAALSALAYSAPKPDLREEIPKLGIDRGVSKVANITDSISKKIPPIGNINIGQNKTAMKPQEDLQNCSGGAICTSEKITRVVDGDTIYTTSYKIRLSLTNTPERGDAGYSEASQFTESLCPVGSIAWIDQDDGQPTDVYGRIVAKVTCSDKNVNAEILEAGHGYILKQYCSKSEFSSEIWAQKFGC